MSAKYVMALDAGTTSNRCILFDRQGNMCSVAQKEFRQIYPQPGWVEHDPKEIWSTQLGVAVEAMGKVGAQASDIAAIGITNQRETTIVWDRETGEPVYNAIVWQCRRTSEYADSLKERGLTDMIRDKTGLIIDAYFSATKIRWILTNVPGAREKAEAGKLLFGTVETWLIWKLTEGRVHVTDYSNAARTMLFNINTLDWDDDILKELDIPRSMLPTPMPSSAVYGEADPKFFGGPIPIGGAAGDHVDSEDGACVEQGVADVVTVSEVHELASAEVSELLLDGDHVGQCLTGVLEVVETADDGDGCPLSELVHHLVVEGTVHDTVGEAAEDPGGVLDGLAVAHLHLGDVQVEGVSAELGDGDVEGGPGPGAGFLEHHGKGLSLEGVPVVAAFLLELDRKIDECGPLVLHVHN